MRVRALCHFLRRGSFQKPFLYVVIDFKSRFFSGASEKRCSSDIYYGSSNSKLTVLRLQLLRVDSGAEKSL